MTGKEIRDRLLANIGDPIIAWVNTSEHVKMDRVAARKAWRKDFRDFGKADRRFFVPVHPHVPDLLQVLEFSCNAYPILPAFLGDVTARNIEIL